MELKTKGTTVMVLQRTRITFSSLISILFLYDGNYQSDIRWIKSKTQVIVKLQQIPYSKHSVWGHDEVNGSQSLPGEMIRVRCLAPEADDQASEEQWGNNMWWWVFTSRISWRGNRIGPICLCVMNSYLIWEILKFPNSQKAATYLSMWVIPTHSSQFEGS